MKGRMIKEMMRMNTTEIKLEAKLVGDIQGFFFVPSYQRGYRWGDAEVIRLLDDIYATEGKRNYCLQPVVVRKNGDRFELIDGQQRLTTLYLIYRYMNEAKYITACEAAGLYPWRYYYVKYPVFRPGVYGKLSNSHADEKPYLFSVMQTKTQWSSNTYMPYLKAADGAHLSKDFMGQRLIYGDRHIICANNAYLLRNNDDESVIDIVRISQSEVGIDLEDRIKKLKAYITTL